MSTLLLLPEYMIVCTYHFLLARDYNIQNLDH
jgi:hypothetical protein